MIKYIAAAVVLLSAAHAIAEEPSFELSGTIATDLRIFPESRAHKKQSGAAFNPSLVLRPELRYQWNGGDDRITEG